MIADPEIRIHERSSEDELLIISSDGVWDGVGNNDAAQIVYNILRPNNEQQPTRDHTPTAADLLSQGEDQADHEMRRAAQEERCASAADALLEAALGNGSTDNMVAIVVDLKPSVSGSKMIGKKLFE